MFDIKPHFKGLGLVLCLTCFITPLHLFMSSMCLDLSLSHSRAETPYAFTGSRKWARDSRHLALR